MNFAHKLSLTPGKKVHFSQHNPDDTLGYKKDKNLESRLKKMIERLDHLQYRLYAENKRALLIILQGMDASGKDGTIRHVMTGLNPQGCRVTAFKQPSAEEARHDFLWRVHTAVPPKGDVGIFNRSQYEDVLIARVHKLFPENVWSKRYDQINAFEKLLVQNDIKIAKFFLHISKDEQKKRFDKRIKDPDRQWKLSLDDFKEREYWDDYQNAYQDALTKCNTEHAPWYIIPANKKWFRNLAVSNILVEILDDMNLKFPKPEIDVSKLKWT